MNSVTSAPVTAAVFAAVTLFLSGCIAYDAASTVVHAGATVVSTTGHIVAAPLASSDDQSH